MENETLLTLDQMLFEIFKEIGKLQEDNRELRKELNKIKDALTIGGDDNE